MNKKLKNKIMAVLLCCVWLLSPVTPVPVYKNMTALAAGPLWDGTVATSFAGGTGTEADPYLISDGAQLAYFSQCVNSGTTYAGQYIRLTQDILLNEMNADGSFVSKKPKKFQSIGTSNKRFQGYFDGYGNEVTGLYVNESWPDYWGLFGYAGDGSVIRNVSISGSVKGRNYTGGVAGYTNGVIAGCAVNAAVTGGESYAGGIAGYAAVNSEITDCTVSGTVQGRYYVGGVAGRTDVSITDCTVDGTVTALENYAGGIAGYAAGADNEITNCTVSGTVQGRYYVGGVVGRIEGGDITGCSVGGTVKAQENYAGGVAGYAADQSVVSDSSASGSVSGRYYVGGVAGRTDETVTGCSSDCTVTGIENYIGGVAGYADTDSEVSNSYASGTVSGRYFIGGVAGYTDGLITVCVNSGAVTGIEGYIGGVVGYADSSNTVSNCFNEGAVAGRDSIGGIAGAGNWTGDESTIHNNLSTGSVTGSTNVGGIVGSSQAPLDPDDAWNNYYINAPAGTGGGDVPEEDGAVPIGDMSWEEVVDRLNSNNPAGDDVWSEDENGIPVPGIFVPHDAVEIVNANIKEGRHYTAALLGTGTSAAVTSDSVFTAAFSMRYNETYHLETQTIGLANEGTVVPLPANTSIIMLVDGVYYYKNLAAELGTRLALGEFIKMGSATENYAPAEPVPAGTEKEYLFIFDFSKTAPGIASGAYKVELLTAAGTSAGAMPSVTVAGVNAYSLTASGENGSVHINLSRTPVEGYDYKTDGKSYACELQLERGGVTVPFPIGAKINGAAVTSTLPYVFTAAAFGDNNVSIDMSGCAAPFAPGSYDLRMKAYACTAAATPRDGYLLAGGGTTLAVAAPGQYAIRARAAARVFDKSAAAVPVVFNIETLGSGAVKSTLQRKYGASYVNMAGQTDLPVSITGGGATLTVPAGCENGTYRFVLTLYDNNAAPRAQSAESVIIK
ncbi:The GLUG motif protein [Pelotomaculum schinkii]|uniref:The GLUG motif protein n=1 Tax=Pelotomaculum schinkii TaxID=78350 RepID=A0A4Y7RHC0_9FIRM|nr:GLUG motif-containing protein [Pelotomaculum schinkii]TEB08150.1 The GLUG motif protein [Pelotomaculum schinkii]